MGRRKDSLNSGTALKSPQLTALAARCRRSVWWASPIASPLSQTWKAIDDSNSPLLLKLKTRTLLHWWSSSYWLSSTLWADSFDCSARDWDRNRITWGNPQSGCSEICSYLMGHCRCTRAYVTKRNSGMKRVKCGWTQPLFHKVSNHWFSGRNLKG